MLVSRRSDSQYSAWFNALLDVDFHNCEYGGTRPKSTRFKTNCVRLQPLARECTRSHTHAPFAARLGTSGWVFDTSLEAEYPLDLCTAYCRILCQQFKLSLPPPSSVRAAALALRGKQAPRFQSLIPEFHRIRDVTSLGSDDASSSLDSSRIAPKCRRAWAVDNSCGMSSPSSVRHSGQGTPQLKHTGMSLNQGIVQGSLTEKAQFS